MLSGIIPKKIHLDFPQKLKCVNIKCLSLGKYCVLYLVRRGIKMNAEGIGSCKNRTSPQVEVELLAFFFAPSFPALLKLG